MSDSEATTRVRDPIVAVVGRPNVGKSTLVNRIIGRREAVVQDVPGVTRDRIAYDAFWAGQQFTLVDTGGWEPDSRGLQAGSRRRPSGRSRPPTSCCSWSTALTGATATDLTVARTLAPVEAAGDPRRHQGRRCSRRVRRGRAVVARTGRTAPGQRTARAGQRRPAGRDPGRPARRARRDATSEGGPRRVALVGRPNVGKSSLLNRLTGEERSVVDSVAGTTIDPVDSLVELDGEIWRFVDTAGLRRRVNQAAGMEYYASLRTASAIESAEVAMVLLDASEPMSEQDQRIIAAVVEAGRALVIAFNKWDLRRRGSPRAARTRDRRETSRGCSGRRG